MRWKERNHSMERMLAAMLALCILLLAGACREEEDTAPFGTTPGQTVTPPSQARPVVAPPPPGSGVGATGLTWSAPADWVVEAPDTRMRKAQYRVPGEAGDAECVVFYFGPGQGGDPSANAQRWARQFTLADGSPGTAGMKVDSRKVGGIDVLTVEVAGTYEGGFGMGSQQEAPKPGQMLLGAIAQGPDANWFFKLTGPEATVAGERAAFDELVGSLKRGSQP
jgi:hypothetical protein